MPFSAAAPAFVFYLMNLFADWAWQSNRIYSEAGVSQQAWHLNHGRNCSEIENFYNTVCLFGLFVRLFVMLVGTFNSFPAAADLEGKIKKRSQDGGWRMGSGDPWLTLIYLLVPSSYPNGIKSLTALQCALVL